MAAENPVCVERGREVYTSLGKTTTRMLYSHEALGAAEQEATGALVYKESNKY